MASNSGEKTEKPTAKRKKDAREKGQVARSRELAAALSLVAATLALLRFGPLLVARIGERMASGLARLGDHPQSPLMQPELAGFVWSAGALTALIVGPIAGVAALASVGASVAQTGWMFTTKPLEMDFSRMSPSNGVKRFAPSQGGLELLRSAAGLIVLLVIGWGTVWELTSRAPELVAMTPAEAARDAWGRLWSLMWRASLALTALGAIDFGVQRYKWTSSLKMTKQEVKEESRSSEGSPEIKARVRRIQRDMARQRMLTAVKQATVVITNPTHYAVALEYRRERMSAPIVVAKGQDLMAARIRAIAREHGVPIVENPPLARTLHKDTEIGDVIPAPLFGAVAEVLAYLVRIKQLMF
jgi:flagellar biosynthetic protein FlhB